MKSLRSLLGSKRKRVFREPKRKSHSLSFKRKQRVKFRPRYAGSLAKSLGKWAGTAAMTAVVVGGIGWGAVYGYRLWGKSETLRVQSVVFSGDIPSQLKATLPIKAKDHLLKMSAAKLEAESLQRFPELRELTIRRNLNRIVTVDGAFRFPVAKTHAQGKEMGVDAAGVIFPVTEIPNVPETLPWVETSDAKERVARLSDLSTWKKSTPDFYSLVKKIETDRMRNMTVELSDGVFIDWGEAGAIDAVTGAKRIQRLRENFSPVKTPAKLTMVAEDRIVMDSNWKKSGQ